LVASSNVSVIFDLIFDEGPHGFGDYRLLFSIKICFPKILHTLDQILIEPQQSKTRTL